MRKRKGRQEPVSCQLCRSKKLRCNRAQPCSNCESRNVSCHFLVPPPISQRGGTPETYQDNEIIARIERLESLVLPEGSPGEKRSDNQLAFTPYSEDASQYRDLYLLENVGVRENSLISSLSNGLAFTICSVDYILNSQGNSQHIFSTCEERLSKTTVVLPTYKTAVILVDCFEAHVDHMCRILYLPIVRSLMKSVYTRINQDGSVLPGQVALLLALFALSAFFYQPTSTAEVLAIGNDTTYLSKFWSRGALDVLEHSRRNTSGTLEDVQALILMSYVTYHLDGFSARYRHLLAIAVSMAQDLGLHRLDSNDCAPKNDSSSLRVLIDHEVKRRVYWHLIASDWTQSTMSGPQEGRYSIHPNHIQTKLPKDYDDGDVFTGDEDESLAEARPTGVTFLLARIRLAHLSREYTDTIPLETSRLMRVPYEHIVSFDQKLKDFLMELPYFFRLDEESRQRSKHLEAVYTKIPMMRYCILAAAHSRRCRLHQKFLVRMSSNPQYDYSRRVCLDSARAVIQLYEEPKAEGESPLETARMAMAVHYTHLALVIQVMDLCFNRVDADYDERKKEVFKTLQMLAGARTISPLLDRSLNSVVEVLRKHKVWLSEQSLTSDSPQNSANQPYEVNLYGFEGSDANLLQHNMEIGEGALAIVPSINDFWHSANQFEMEFDSTTWDNLFSTLDSRPF